jgi:hypothetical protein
MTRIPLDQLAKTTFYVYALVDPRDDKPRYVGITLNPERRLKAHLGKGKQAGRRRVEWLALLSSLGLRPALRILAEVVGPAAALRAEQEQHDRGVKFGWPLLNGTRNTHSALCHYSVRQLESA